MSANVVAACALGISAVFCSALPLPVQAVSWSR